MSTTAARLRAGAAALVLTLATLTTLAAVDTPAHADPVQPPASVVELLTPQHPRLLATAQTFSAAARRIGTDPRLKAWYAQVKAGADGVLATSPPTALSTSVIDEAKRRVYALALVYRITGETRYAERAARELVALSSAPAWDKEQFLEVGELSNSVAIGYDWLYDYLSASDKATIRSAIVTKALRPALVRYGYATSFYTQNHNWNLVCNAVALGALAIGDDPGLTADERGVVDQVLRASITSIQNGISGYGPDGGSGESPQYWQYATEYLVLYLAAMKTATGTDFGLSDLPGLAGTGDYGIHVTGATGLTFNYGDGGTDLLGAVTPTWQAPFMMWLATRYGKPYYMAWQARLADRSASPMDILWYDPADAGGAGHPAATDAFFDGVEIATARGAWDDPYAVSVATKGMRAGYDQIAAHENLDAGDFVLDAAGVRWFDDLGLDSYSLPGYFDWTKDTGGRWDYYVTRPEGQNTMRLGTGPTPSTALTVGAPITTVSSTPQKWYEITDLTGLYGGRVQRAERGLQLFDDRRQVLLQDEVKTSEPIGYWSFLHTRADVVVAADGRSATLHRGGQRLWVQLLTTDGRLLIGDSRPLPDSPDPTGQSRQPGSRTLAIQLTAAGTTTVAMRMVPLAAGQKPPTDTPAVTPLASWTPSATGPAALTDIMIGADHLAGFDPRRYRYDITLPANTTAPPKVVPLTPSGTYATVTRATAIPGTATVTTFRLDANRQKVYGPAYQVHFRQAGKTATALPVASVTASANEGGPAADAVDGNMGSRWAAAGDGRTLTLDLGAKRTVGAVAVAFFNGHARTSTFDVLTSTDGTTWNAALTGAVSAGTSDDAEVFSFTARPARHVRLVGHGNSVSSYNSVTEIRVYAGKSDAQADAAPRPVVLGTVTPSPAGPPALSIGDTLRLSLTGKQTDGRPADLSTATITWTSSHPAVATVDGSGLVTAAGGGSAKVGALVIHPPMMKVVRVPVSVVDPSHIEPVADGFVRDGAYAATAFGTGSVLEVRNNPSLGSGFDRVAYLTFPLTAAHGTVVSATLHVYGSTSDAAGATDAVHAVTDATWSEATLTWNTRPPLGAGLGTFTLDTAASWHTVDVTAFVQARLAAGQDVSLAITSTATAYGPFTSFSSKEATDNHPYLELTLS
ncbi:DNRLRE domain-containing protein [Nonomuraea sp. NPDC052116]|uniref:CBM96 family carbohydrate-binding protein n=1 Tax=Nonomuraea sp. NPDC052116 TaxID=3155665 RepID=UPI00341BCB8B